MPGATTTCDVLILGAGAAGLMCAFTAARRSRRVILLDHADRPGRKILISGGGRCNFTNLHTTPENFLSANPHFARSALARFPPADMIALVRAHNIAFHEKTLGQLFCDGSAQQIVTLLERECAAAGVLTRLATRVLSVHHEALGFHVETSTGAIACTSLVIATGGLSIPKLGATSFGYDLARQFNHTLIAPRPALVPLTLAPTDHARWCDLAGVSAEVLATATLAPKREHPFTSPAKHERTITFREKLLITHRGLSGPAVLQISSYWQPGQQLTFDLAPDQQILAPLLAPNARRDPTTLLGALRNILPTRWAERWLATLPTLDLTTAGLTRLEASLHNWTLTPAGTEGFAKAEVTAGGVDTRELDARTLQSRRVPGLYFIGEVVDVTGWLGGYNFQWAWASATAAGESV